MNYVLKSAMQSFPLCFYIFASSLVVFSCLTLTLAAWGREGERECWDILTLSAHWTRRQGQIQLALLDCNLYFVLDGKWLIFGASRNISKPLFLTHLPMWCWLTEAGLLDATERHVQETLFPWPWLATLRKYCPADGKNTKQRLRSASGVSAVASVSTRWRRGFLR